VTKRVTEFGAFNFFTLPLPQPLTAPLLLNFTAVGALVNGFLGVHVSPFAAPIDPLELFQSSVLNFGPYGTVSNLAWVGDGDGTGDETITIITSQNTDVVVDLVGTFDEGSFQSIGTPVRLVDTRPDQSPEALLTVEKTKLKLGEELVLPVTDLHDADGNQLVPKENVGAVAVNLTITNAVAPGYATVYPCGSETNASNINYVPGEDRANSVTAPVSASGEICVKSSQDVDVVVDLSGWFPKS
jgi:hypothetical protein